MAQYTILIVDDDENVLKSLTRALIDDKYVVRTAVSGEEGLLKLENHDIDLVISDQRMPGMGGLEFLKKIQAEYPETLTIMLTAYGDIETAIGAINEAGVHKFILKPWHEAELRVTIMRALELRRLITERNVLRQEVKKREAILRELERKYPGITEVTRDVNGTVLVEV